MKKTSYKCEDCGKQIEIDEFKENPVCCGKKMKHLPLDICIHPNDPEAARNIRDDEPCDQGR